MISERGVYIVIFDGFADWEPAYALAELRRSGKRVVRTIGFTSAPVVSMGGLRITPDLALGAARAEEIELLILPGGDRWESDDYPRAALESLITAIVSADVAVAAICAGT